MTSELETNIVAVERVSEYTKIKNEVPLKLLQEIFQTWTTAFIYLVTLFIYLYLSILPHPGMNRDPERLLQGGSVFTDKQITLNDSKSILALNIKLFSIIQLY